MFNSSNGYSLADIAAATGNNGANGDFFGGNGAWWIIILFLFVFTGWGNGNWGGYGVGAQGAADNYVLASDFATLQRQLSDGFNSLERKEDTINNGLCDGFYAQNTTLLNGFSGVQGQISQGIADVTSTVTNGFNTQNLTNLQNSNAIQRDIYANTVSGNQNTTAIQNQLAQCCCDLKSLFADTNYNMATNTCAINTNLSNSTRDIVDSQNANTRAILDAIAQSKVDAMQDKIATLTAQNQSLQFAASQAAQNDYLTNALRPCPVPAYVVANPYCNCGQQIYGCGC